jgi:hypothetical protein
MATVNKVHIDPVSLSNKFGQLKAASLELHGLLLQATGYPHTAFLSRHAGGQEATVTIPGWNPEEKIQWQLYFDDREVAKQFYKSARSGHGDGAPITLFPIQEIDDDPTPDLEPDTLRRTKQWEV